MDDLHLKKYSWIKIILDDPDLNFYEKSLAMYFSTFMNIQNDMAWPSYQRIQKDMKITAPTISKYISSLEEAGYLKVKKYKLPTARGVQEGNMYQIDLPKKVLKDVKSDKEGTKGALVEGTKGALVEVLKDVKCNKQGNKQCNKPLTPHTPHPTNLPDWLDADAWSEFEQHRKDIRKPLSVLSMKKNLAVLEKYKTQQREIIDASIASRWTGLFAPKGGSNENNQPRRLTLVERVRQANGLTSDFDGNTYENSVGEDDEDLRL